MIKGVVKVDPSVAHAIVTRQNYRTVAPVGTLLLDSELVHFRWLHDKTYLDHTNMIIQTAQKIYRLFFTRPSKAINDDVHLLKLAPVAPGAISIVEPPPVLAVPVRVDGSGKVLFGAHVFLGFLSAPRLGDGEILIQARTPEALISIGEKTVISNNVSLVANLGIKIGPRCLIGNGALIVDSDFHHVDPIRRHDDGSPCKAIDIGANVWIGASAIVLKGTQIGENSVVGAGAVVTRNVPPNVVVAGNPAKIIRHLENPH